MLLEISEADKNTKSEGYTEYTIVNSAQVARADGGELAQIAAVIDKRPVKPVVTTVILLSEAKKVQEMSESRHTHGKIVLRVAEDPQ